MSTSPYSIDLRERVIKYLKEDNGYKAASKIFSVSISAIGRWYRRYKQEGQYKPRERLGAIRKIDLNILEEYVKATPDMKLKDASFKFKVSTWTIQYWLKELGYSYKKKPLTMWKQVRKREINT
jgi:transposase